MSPTHGDSQAGLSRQGGPCLGLAPGVPQVNTCSHACHHPQPASLSPPPLESTPPIPLLRSQFRGSTLIPLFLAQPPSSSSANPVSSRLKVYPERASSSSPVLTLLDYYHGPLYPHQSTLEAAAADPAQMSGNQFHTAPHPPHPTSAPSSLLPWQGPPSATPHHLQDSAENLSALGVPDPSSNSHSTPNTADSPCLLSQQHWSPASCTHHRTAGFRP